MENESVKPGSVFQILFDDSFVRVAEEKGFVKSDDHLLEAAGPLMQVPKKDMFRNLTFVCRDPKTPLQLRFSANAEHVIMDFSEQYSGGTPALFSRTLFPFRLLYPALPGLRQHPENAAHHGALFRQRIKNGSIMGTKNPMQEGPWLEIMQVLSNAFPFVRPPGGRGRKPRKPAADLT